MIKMLILISYKDRGSWIYFIVDFKANFTHFLEVFRSISLAPDFKEGITAVLPKRVTLPEPSATSSVREKQVLQEDRFGGVRAENFVLLM